MALKGTIQSTVWMVITCIWNTFTKKIFNALASIRFPIGCLHVSSKDLWMSNWKCNFDAIIATVAGWLEWSPSIEKLIHDCRLKYSVSHCLGFDWFPLGALGTGYKCINMMHVFSGTKWRKPSEMIRKNGIWMAKKLHWWLFFFSFEYDDSNKEWEKMGREIRKKKILARKHWTMLSIDYNLMFRVPVQFLNIFDHFHFVLTQFRWLAYPSGLLYDYNGLWAIWAIRPNDFRCIVMF